MKRVISFLIVVTMMLSMVSFSFVVSAATENLTATLSVENVSAAVDSYIDVAINITENPGIVSMGLTLTFDEDLTLVGAANGEAFAELNMTPPAQLKKQGSVTGSCRFAWLGSDDCTETGTILVLTFMVSADAEMYKDCQVSVSCDEGDILDNSRNSISLIANPGKVTIIDYLPGDVDDSDTINMLDVLTLCQYYVDGCKYDPEGYAIDLKAESGDVDANGKINMLDILTICQYYVDGCKYDPNGYGVKLLPGKRTCQHNMQYFAAKEATCEEDGNNEYWYCDLCKDYFGDAEGKDVISYDYTIIKTTGHTIVIDEAVAPTPDTEGLTEGSHCSVCNKVIVAQNKIPPTEVTTYDIDYDIANGDPYLEKLFKNGELVNPNAHYYEEGVGLVLSNPSVEGYRFLGWYDMAENGAHIKKIDADATGEYQLYAYWSKIEYTVQYKSSLFVDQAKDIYTVDTGLVLPTPKLSNYNFVGWSDESGKLLTGTTIPVGTTGNMILEGNWTSERNKTWTKPVLDDPIIETDEENGVILFAYEIGEVQNVPLYTIKDFGYISGDGVTKTERTTYQITITDTMMKSYAKSVAKATTESSNWTLASTWNETTSVNEEWCKENGKNIEEVNEVAKSDSQNWNISNSNSGSTETVSTTTNQDGWKNEVKVNSSSSHTDSDSTVDKTYEESAWNVDAKLTYTPKSYSFGIDVFEVGGVNASTSGGWGGEIGGGYEHKWGEEHIETEEHSDTTSSGLELGGSHDKSTLTTSGTTSTASWNNTTSYGGSSTNSTTQTNSTALSEKISQAYGYGSSYATGGESGSSQGLSASQTDSESYSSSVTYSTEVSEEVTSEWTTQATKGGYHRWVVAGTAHVFAVVGYDMAQKSYFVYTYSVMDDETHEFEDYSYISNDYNDHENGVISFEIPYEVAEYVKEKTSYSDGLKVNQETGVITEYTGSDNCVVIPEYWNVGNGDIVKVTGIDASAFKGNKNIRAVVLSDFITEIPDNAFQGCTSLQEVVGGNVVKIGSYAFDGCTNVEDLGVRSSVEDIGEKAFGGVQRIIVNASNKDVLKAAVESGTEQIIVSLEYLDNGPQELNGIEITVPEGTKFFEINGQYNNYEDFSLISNADITVINKMNFVGQTRIPVIISSPEVVLNQSTITAPGIGLVLRAEVCHLGLQGNITIQSDNENTMLAKGLNLYEVNKNVVGKLVVRGKLLQCGDTEVIDYLSYETYEKIDSTTFKNLLNSFKLYFDANGGSCDEEYRIVPNSTKLGVLPIPTKTGFDFAGWFDENGKQITEDSVINTTNNVTIVAKWVAKSYSVAWENGDGYTITVNRVSSPYINADVGTLNNGDMVYYGDVLNISYTRGDYYRIISTGATSITVTRNITSSDIYAIAELNPVSGWVLESQLPADAQVMNTKWTYTRTQNTESTSSSMSGWTQTGSYWNQTHSESTKYASFPSGFDTTNSYYSSYAKSAYSAYDNGSTKREVTNSWSGYIYWHWMYNVSYSTGTGRTIADRKCEYDNKNFKYFYAIASTVDCPELTDRSYVANYNAGSAPVTYNCKSILPSSTGSTDGMGTPRMFRFSYYTSTYIDYQKVYQYQKITTGIESSTDVAAGGEISNVQKWVQYRAK